MKSVMSPPHDTPEDRWQFRLNLVGVTLVAVLLAAFFFFYGNDLLNFLSMLFGPPQTPYY
jgi:hypothetical protein